MILYLIGDFGLKTFKDILHRSSGYGIYVQWRLLCLVPLLIYGIHMEIDIHSDNGYQGTVRDPGRTTLIQIP